MSTTVFKVAHPRIKACVECKSEFLIFNSISYYDLGTLIIVLCPSLHSTWYHVTCERYETMVTHSESKAIIQQKLINKLVQCQSFLCDSLNLNIVENNNNNKHTLTSTSKAVSIQGELVNRQAEIKRGTEKGIPFKQLAMKLSGLGSSSSSSSTLTDIEIITPILSTNINHILKCFNAFKQQGRIILKKQGYSLLTINRLMELCIRSGLMKCHIPQEESKHVHTFNDIPLSKQYKFSEHPGGLFYYMNNRAPLLIHISEPYRLVLFRDHPSMPTWSTKDVAYSLQLQLIEWKMTIFIHRKKAAIAIEIELEDTENIALAAFLLAIDCVV